VETVHTGPGFEYHCLVFGRNEEFKFKFAVCHRSRVRHWLKCPGSNSKPKVVQAGGEKREKDYPRNGSFVRPPKKCFILNFIFIQEFRVKWLKNKYLGPFKTGIFL